MPEEDVSLTVKEIDFIKSLKPSLRDDACQIIVFERSLEPLKKFFKDSDMDQLYYTTKVKPLDFI